MEVPTPGIETEPGLSMEMVRHFQHDIVVPKIFDVSNAVVKSCKYLDRSYTSLIDSGGKPSDPALADFAKKITKLANQKPQTKEVRNEIVNSISDYLNSKPRVIWDNGTQKLILNIDTKAVDSFHKKATDAMWKTVVQGSKARTSEMDKRLIDLLARKRGGENVKNETDSLRKEMVALVDMVEAEIKAAQGMEIPVEVRTNNAKIRKMLDTLSRRFGVKKLSAEELKDKKFIEELLRAEADHQSKFRRKMLIGYLGSLTKKMIDQCTCGRSWKSKFLGRFH